jgi:hypothetical protein
VEQALETLGPAILWAPVAFCGLMAAFWLTVGKWLARRRG